MEVVVQHSELRRPEDLLLGALAALALRDTDILRTPDITFHKRFGRALTVFRDGGEECSILADKYHQDVVSRTYDLLDHALIAAEQRGWVKFPNPSYSRLEISMTRRDAERILARWPAECRATFEAAADVLLTDDDA